MITTVVTPSVVFEKLMGRVPSGRWLYGPLSAVRGGAKGIRRVYPTAH